MNQVEWNETLRNTFYDYIYGINATQSSYCYSDLAKVNLYYMHCSNVIISIYLHYSMKKLVYSPM